jgi:O-Antigen ligase
MIYRGLRLRYLLASSVIATGLFLSFSRGAWGDFLASAIIMVGMMFVTTPNGRFRTRIAAFSIISSIGGTILIAALLSIRAVTKMFEIRAELLQSYDVGSSGRFTTQLRAMHKIIDFPNGLGPLQYAKYFGIDPHNDYLNAFYSNGWIGGVIYPTLVFITLFVGFRALLVRTPWQPYLIAVFAAYFGVVCEGAIVGTEHWRHYYLLLGLVWGLSVATENARRAALYGGTRPALLR